jgi:small subunit ribosomal protein S2
MAKENKQVVSMRELLECGVHFGHQTKRWNPKMKKYIFTSRNGIHVIDLQQTLKLIKQTYQIVKDSVKNGGSVLFVGTKKQAQDAIYNEAAACGMPYVHHRWLGGTLTNNITLQQSIHKLKDYQRMNDEGLFDQLSKKEASKKGKKLTKLEYYLEGIKDLNKLPAFVFIVDTKREQLAVREANRLKIPIIGVVDTNADPTEIQYPIPANDDAIRAVRLICSIVSKAVLDGKGQNEVPAEASEKAAVPAAAVASPASENKESVATKPVPQAATKVVAKEEPKVTKDSTTTT